MFNISSSWAEFVVALEEINACEESLSWCKLERHEDISLEEGILDYLTDEEATQNWADWILRNHYDWFDNDIRILWFQKINDPMIAFRLYIDAEALTIEEEESLKSIFEGKLPTAEKELEEGKIIIGRYSI